MAKFPTFPKLYDNSKTLSINFLKNHNYLIVNQIKTGSITWSANGYKTDSISITSSISPNDPYIELNYKYNDATINYKVKLISIQSNLGKGVVWYFICPKTNKRCKKLYLIDTYFYHRTAFRGCMYENQTKSKNSRNTDKLLNRYMKSEQLIEQIFEKNFKKYYAGKPTKKYLKILNEMNYNSEKLDSLNKYVLTLK